MPATSSMHESAVRDRQCGILKIKSDQNDAFSKAERKTVLMDLTSAPEGELMKPESSTSCDHFGPEQDIIKSSKPAGLLAPVSRARVRDGYGSLMSFRDYSYMSSPPWLEHYRPDASPRFRNVEALPRFFPPLNRTFRPLMLSAPRRCFSWSPSV